MTIKPQVSSSSPSSRVGIERLTIVTASDQVYWRCLYQFLCSAQRLQLHLHHDFVAYDLGLGADTREWLQSRFPWCEWRPFRFENYPPHISGIFRALAWKPFLLQEVLQSTNGLVLWLDSATLFKHALDGVIADIRRFGVYSLRGQAALSLRCDPDILDALSVPLQVRQRQERVGGVLGFDGSNPAARKLVSAWCQHHLVTSHVRAGTPTHRAEQALLSIAMLTMEATGELTLPDAEIDISSHRPVRWMTSRNKVPAWLPLWLDPAARAYYATYKAVDRANLKWRQRCANLANGLHRIPKEHFTIFVGSASTKRVVEIAAPALSYYADPFVWWHQGRAYLLCEEFRYPRHKGYLRCMEIGADLRPGRPEPIISCEKHASFPFLLEDRGTTYLVPETSAEGGIHLYRCDEFPRTWTRVRTLLPAIDAADTVIFSHEAHWWLITSIRVKPDSAARCLAVFFADDLLTGQWHPHPVNSQRLYGELQFSSGRNAGGVIRSGAQLLRPSQHNLHYYGETIRWMEITQLTETAYCEREIISTHPLARFSARLSMHHMTVHGDLVAWDVRDRNGPLPRLSARVKPSRRLSAVGLDKDIVEAISSSS